MAIAVEEIVVAITFFYFVSMFMMVVSVVIQLSLSQVSLYTLLRDRQLPSASPIGTTLTWHGGLNLGTIHFLPMTQPSRKLLLTSKALKSDQK